MSFRFKSTLLIILAGISTLYAGTLHEKSLSFAGVQRSYSIYVPEAYDGTSAWPLVINYHGYTSTKESQISESSMNAVADTAHFLVVYPQGLNISIPQGILPNFVPLSGNGWGVPGFSSAVDDVGFTTALIDSMEANYSIDSLRIHLTGVSLGSYMALYAASQLSERIASVAAVIGHMTDEGLAGLQLSRPLSALIIHGTADQVTFFNGKAGYYPSVPDVISAWRTQNGCGADSSVSTLPNPDLEDNSTVTRIHYSTCDDNTEVILLRVNNGGHRWFGSGLVNLPDLLGANSGDIHASSEILNFFRDNPQMTAAVSIDAGSGHHQPTNFRLEQNYPNPFNPSTRISYTILTAGHVSLSIYDVNGRLIRTLAEVEQAPGQYRVQWNGLDEAGHPVSTGIYFARLKSVMSSQTIKMMLLH